MSQSTSPVVACIEEREVGKPTTSDLPRNLLRRAVDCGNDRNLDNVKTNAVNERLALFGRF